MKKQTAPPKAEAAKIAGGGKGGKGGKQAGGAASTGKEKPDLVIWHWTDERLQSQQQVQANQDKNFNFLAIYRPAEKKFLRLADESLRQVTAGPKARWAIGLDSKPYQLMSTLDGRQYHDIYTIDLQTGTRRLALSRIRWYSGTSPTARTSSTIDDGHFFTYEMATGKSRQHYRRRCRLVRERRGRPQRCQAADQDIGWSKDGAFVLLSDNWDVWKVPVHGGPGVNLTADGKKDAIRYRARICARPRGEGYRPRRPDLFLAPQTSGPRRRESAGSIPARRA